MDFSALDDPRYTYVNDKLTCLRDAWFAHIFFCYLLFLTGIFAMLARMLPPSLKWVHRWFGIAYIISMLWAMFSSLIIHNEGLPIATLISFIWVVGFLTLGWILIRVHMYYTERAACERVQLMIQSGAFSGSLADAIAKQKASIAASKTFVQRFFSLKAAHGALFFTSWLNIAGRIFASNQSGDFTCYTYPYYKQIDTTHFAGASAGLVPVPLSDPDYMRLPWARLGNVGWGLALSLGPLLGALLVGAIISAVNARQAQRRGPEAAEQIQHEKTAALAAM